MLLITGVAEPCFGRLARPKIQLAIFEMVKETIRQILREITPILYKVYTL